MIVRPKQNWFQLLFAWDGSILQSIIPQLVLTAIVSLLALFTGGSLFGEKITFNTIPLGLTGVVLTIFLAFRNNASYERYREARVLWGNILIAARTMTSQVFKYVQPDPGPERIEFVHRLIAIVYALKHQLRQTDALEDLRRYLPAADLKALIAARYKPTALVDELRGVLARFYFDGRLTDIQLSMLDAQLSQITTAIGGCERIASTPIPFAYGVLLHRTVYAYCALLPFGLVDSIGLITPLISVFVAYTLFGLEAIASEIAEPFGTAPNNLALDYMTRTIERSLLELCKQTLPAEIEVGQNYQLT